MENTNQTPLEPIEYALMQHETTEDLWAIKLRGKTVLGARSFRQQDEPYVEDLPHLTYDVGAPRDYADTFRQKMAIWPFPKRRPADQQ